VIAGAIVALIIVDFPALYDGTLLRPESRTAENVPAYWMQPRSTSIRARTDTRRARAAGSDFASYVWGNTVDPSRPGLMTGPYVARELIRGAAPPRKTCSMRSTRIQEGTFEAGGFAALARRMGVGAVDLRYDLAFKRFNTTRPEPAARLRARSRVTLAKTFGPPLHGKASTEFVDETTLATPPERRTEFSRGVHRDRSERDRAHRIGRPARRRRR